jgi:cobalt-zinc-cadmium efflux system protein
MATHDHGAGPAGGHIRRRLTITLGLVSGYAVAEVVGGVIANSLALLADAGHMVSDAGAIALALFAIWFARRPATPRHTYGYYRAEILAALVNAATLVAISVYIFVEAYERFRAPSQVHGGIMIGIAAGGLIVNLIALWTLHGYRRENLNIRGAWLHVLSDVLGSMQAVIAGALILLFGWWWVDPTASILIGALVIHSSWTLMRESVGVLMESAPANLDVDAVRSRLMAIPGVLEVRDLHIWTITTGLVALSAHIVVETLSPGMLQELRQELQHQFGIHHTTIQFDLPGDAHSGCPPVTNASDR